MPETIAIILHIAAEHASAFEALFAAEEIPIWDDYTRRGLFLDASLVRVVDGSERLKREGVQDYLLHLVVADHDAHEEHDRDPRFQAFLAKAQQLQPDQPMVWFGQALVERRAGAPPSP